MKLLKQERKVLMVAALCGAAFSGVLGCKELIQISGLGTPQSFVYVSDSGLTYIDTTKPVVQPTAIQGANPNADSMVLWAQKVPPTPTQDAVACECEKIVYTSGGSLYTLSVPSFGDTIFPFAASTHPTTKTIDLGGRQAAAVAYDGNAGTSLFVAMPSSAAVGVVVGVTEKLDHLIPLPGMSPSQLAIPNEVQSIGGVLVGKTVGYALSGTQIVAFSDDRTNGIVATTDVGQGADSIAVNQGYSGTSGTVVAVTNFMTDSVSFFDANLKLRGKADFSHANFSPFKVYLAQDGSTAYVLCDSFSDQGAVIVVNLSDFTVKPPTLTGNCPADINASVVNNKLYVANRCDNTVSSFPLGPSLGTEEKIMVGTGPKVIAVLDD